MALTINNPVGGGATTLTNTNTTTTTTTSNAHLSLLNHYHNHRSSLSLSSNLRTNSTHIVRATGKFTSRTGKFDSKRNKRGSNSTTTKEDGIDDRKEYVNFENNDVVFGEESVVEGNINDGYFLPELPGDKPDFWEGPQWDAFGFFVQYMWAFGVVFALVACGVAVATYNDGATDFRQTPAFKESVQTGDVLEGPEASDSDVFESNPTEEAPALE